MPPRKKPAAGKKTAPKKKAAPKKNEASRKKAAPKQNATKRFAGGVPVYAKVFTKMLHARNFDTTGEFSVHCNIDGKIDSSQPDGNYDSLDEANDAAAKHKSDKPTHKLTVTAAQTS